MKSKIPIKRYPLKLLSLKRFWNPWEVPVKKFVFSCVAGCSHAVFLKVNSFKGFFLNYFPKFVSYQLYSRDNPQWLLSEAIQLYYKLGSNKNVRLTINYYLFITFYKRRFKRPDFTKNFLFFLTWKKCCLYLNLL